MLEARRISTKKGIDSLRKNPIDIMVRNISYAIGNPVGDLALGHVEPLYWSSQHQDYAPKRVFGDNELGQELHNNILTLSMTSPIVDDPVISFSYPRSKYICGTQGIEEACLKIQFIESGGKVTAVYPNRRDKVLLPGPCFETNLVIWDGSSGGPVFNEKGGVIGVNSTSFEGEGSCFVTPINLISKFKLVVSKEDGSHRRDILFQEWANRLHLRIDELPHQEPIYIKSSPECDMIEEFFRI